LPAGFSLVEPLRAEILPREEDTFTIQLTAQTLGMFRGQVRFTTNDIGAELFEFAVTGTVLPSGPEIVVEANGQELTDGDGTPAENHRKPRKPCAGWT